MGDWDNAAIRCRSEDNAQRVLDVTRRSHGVHRKRKPDDEDSAQQPEAHAATTRHRPIVVRRSAMHIPGADALTVVGIPDAHPPTPASG
jgi:hypothetical protein